MMATFYNSELRDLLNDANKYRDNVQEVYNKISEESIEYMDDLSEGLKYILESTNAEPIEILLGLRLIKDCVLSTPGNFIPYLIPKLLPAMKNIASFKPNDPDPNRGRDYFGSNADASTKKIAMSILRYDLELIYVMSKLFPKEKEITNLYTELLANHVIFPESMHYLKNIELEPISYEKVDVDIKPSPNFNEIRDKIISILKSNENEIYGKEHLNKNFDQLKNFSMSNGHNLNANDMTNAQKLIHLLQRWRESTISYYELRSELIEQPSIPYITIPNSTITISKAEDAIQKASVGDFSQINQFQEIFKEKVMAKSFMEIELIILSLYSCINLDEEEGFPIINVSLLKPSFINILGNYKDKPSVLLVKEFSKFIRIMAFDTSDYTKFQNLYNELINISSFDNVILDESSFNAIYSDLKIPDFINRDVLRKNAIINLQYFLNIFLIEADKDFSEFEFVEDLYKESKALNSFLDLYEPYPKFIKGLEIASEILERGKKDPKKAFLSLKINPRMLELKGLGFIFLGLDVESIYEPNFHAFYLNDFFKKYEGEFKLPETGNKLNEFIHKTIIDPAYKVSHADGKRLEGEFNFVLQNYNFPNLEYGGSINLNNSSFHSMSSRSSRNFISSPSQGLSLNMTLRSTATMNFEKETDLLKENYKLSKEIKQLEQETYFLKCSNLKLKQRIKNIHSKAH